MSYVKQALCKVTTFFKYGPILIFHFPRYNILFNVGILCDFLVSINTQHFKPLCICFFPITLLMLNQIIIIYPTAKGKHPDILIEHQRNTTNHLMSQIFLM